MSGMSHQEMTGPNDMADLPMVMLSSSSCIERVCELAPALLRSHYVEAQVLVEATPAPILPKAILTPEMESQREAVATPPLRPPFVVALQTTIRI
jgi:hypothetical protein